MDVGKLERALKQEWKKYRKQLERCRKSFSAQGVHKLRVETRRLCSNLELFADWIPAKRLDRIESTLKCCLDVFDNLRDTQVQLAALRSVRSQNSAAGLLSDYLLKREERFIKSARKAIRKVRISGLAEDIDFCRKEVASHLDDLPGTVAEAAVLGAVHKAFVNTRRLEERVTPEDTATIHKTRVAFKKFRYMLERLAGQLPGISKRLLESMRQYQTVMGEVQDAEVMLRAFDKFVRKEHVPPQLATHFKEGWRRRRQKRIRAYLRIADRLFGFWPVHGVN